MRGDGDSLCMFLGAAGFVSPDKLRWKDVIFILDLGVDVTFLVDMVITFHTAIWEVDSKVSPLIQLRLRYMLFIGTRFSNLYTAVDTPA
jgi:hypothetical protein